MSIGAVFVEKFSLFDIAILQISRFRYSIISFVKENRHDDIC